MIIADKRFILLLLVILILGEICWNFFGLGAQPSFWWLDNLLHFLGGAMVAGLILNFRFLAGFLESGTFGIQMLLLPALVLFVGVSWEIYEYLTDYFFLGYLGNTFLGLTVADTLSDLIFDMLGGAAAAAIYFNSKAYKEPFLRR